MPFVAGEFHKKLVKNWKLNNKKCKFSY